VVSRFTIAGASIAATASLDDESKENGQCSASGCDDVGQEKNEQALAAGNLSTAFAAGGLALIGGAIVLRVTSPDRKTTIRLKPLVARGTGGLSLGTIFQ
jgi:hypothetical protein